MTRDLLRHAAGHLDDARVRAVLRGDPEAASRLAALHDRVLVEVEYANGVDSGLPMVRRRTLPAGTTVGWLMRHCPATRAARHALGVHVPDVGVYDVADAKGLAA
jgi:hypothetical protein